MDDVIVQVRERLSALDVFMADTTKQLQGFDDKLENWKQTLSRPPGSVGTGTVSESLGRLVAKSEQAKSLVGGTHRGAAVVAIPGRLWNPVTKAIIVSDAGTLKPGTQPGSIAGLPSPPLAVADLIPAIQLSEGSYEFARQLAPRAGAAIQVAQGDLKAETTLTFEMETLTAKTLACWCAASKQSIQDAAGLQLVIDSDLINAIRTLEETEILLGDGTAPHLTGIMPVATAVTLTATDRIDAISELIASLVVAGVTPTAVVLNPADWLGMTILKSTGSGDYLLGSPTQAPPQTMWGVRLALSTAMPAGSALVGDFQRGAMLGYREFANIEISSEHADFFIRNLLAIKAEERVLLAIRQPGLFAKATLPVAAVATATERRK